MIAGPLPRSCGGPSLGRRPKDAEKVEAPSVAGTDVRRGLLLNGAPKGVKRLSGHVFLIDRKTRHEREDGNECGGQVAVKRGSRRKDGKGRGKGDGTGDGDDRVADLCSQRVHALLSTNRQCKPKPVPSFAIGCRRPGPGVLSAGQRAGTRSSLCPPSVAISRPVRMACQSIRRARQSMHSTSFMPVCTPPIGNGPPLGLVHRCRCLRPPEQTGLWHD